MVVQTFDASTTWLCPAGVTVLERVACEGAAGSGGAGANTGTGRGGGGGGAANSFSDNVAVTPGTLYDITVGAGGPSVSSAADGIDGGLSEFLPQGGSVLVRAAGGKGGLHGIAIGNGAGGAGGATADCIGTTKTAGTAGTTGGAGGAGASGGGITGGAGGALSNPGTAPGGAGGGGAVAGASGAGAAGRVVLTYTPPPSQGTGFLGLL